jgi:hypothetical protein
MTLPSMRLLRARLDWPATPPSLTCALRPEADMVRQMKIDYGRRILAIRTLRMRRPLSLRPRTAPWT